MIRPSELLRAADESCYKHYRFYGVKPLGADVYKHTNRDGSYWEVDLGTINWEEHKLEVVKGHYLYDYSKGIASILYNPNAEHIAMILDKVAKVSSFSEEDGTLWVSCVGRN